MGFCFYGTTATSTSIQTGILGIPLIVSYNGKQYTLRQCITTPKFIKTSKLRLSTPSTHVSNESSITQLHAIIIQTEGSFAKNWCLKLKLQIWKVFVHSLLGRRQWRRAQPSYGLGAWVMERRWTREIWMYQRQFGFRRDAELCLMRFFQCRVRHPNGFEWRRMRGIFV